jgi:peptidyl-prolyl cis-trans isomerase D
MLTYMRNRSRTWVKWIIFGAIIIVFVFWGGSSYFGKESNMVAKVDRHIITLQQYSKAYEDTLKGLQDRLGTAPTPDMIKALGLREKVLDQMVDDYILSVEAAKAGVTISDQELQEVIQSYPPFLQDGKFSESNYRRILDYQRLTPADFEDMQRKDLLKQKFFGLITENVIVSPEEVASYYKYQNDAFDLNFIAVDAQQFMKDITVTDQEAGLYFDKNKEKYKVAPKITLSCIMFPAANYLDKATITQEEAMDYYNSHKSEFSTEAKVHGRHILIALPPEADANQVQQKMAIAKKVYDDAKAGGDFAALAKQYSEDKDTKASGGDLGSIAAQGLPKPIKDAFDKMKPGGVAGPVRTNLGIHILKLESKEDAKQTPFEEVSAKVIQSMKARRALILAGDDADTSFKDIYEQGTQNFAAYAQKKGLQMKDIGPFAQGDDIGLPNAGSITKDAFLIPKGEMTNKPVEIGDAYLIYLVKDKVPSRIPELFEVKNAVVKDVGISKALDRAKTYAEGLKKNPGQLNSMPHQTTGAFKRTSGAVPQLEMIQGVMNDLDKLKSPRTYTAGGKTYIVWLGQVQEADLKTADPAQFKQMNSELQNRKKEMAISQYKEDARKRHTVTVSKEKVSPRGLNDLPDNN